eukprot:383066-Prymnesium_polylepis.1
MGRDRTASCSTPASWSARSASRHGRLRKAGERPPVQAKQDAMVKGETPRQESRPPSHGSHLPERRASPSCTNGRAHDPAPAAVHWPPRSRAGRRDARHAVLRSSHRELLGTKGDTR